MVLDAVSDLLGLGGSAPPSVRRPTFEVDFGGNADQFAERVIAIQMSAGLLPSVDVVDIYLSGDDNAPAVAIGDTGSVSLGYEDSSTDTVFTGQVTSVRYTLERITRVTAVNGGNALSQLRLNRSFEQQTAGEIVQNLADELGISTDTVEDGVDFPFYVVDNGRNAHQHIMVLVRKSGYIAYFAPDGTLNFLPFTAGQPVQTFSYGLDILSLNAMEAAAPVGSIVVQGEGAAGSQGSDAWSWLIKDPTAVRGEAGGGDPKREITESSLRSGDATTSTAESIVGAAGLMTLTGELRVPGAPLALLGSAIEITGAPQAVLNGVCLVRWIRHSYSKRGGFVSHIGFSKTGEGGAGGGLLDTLGGLL